MLDAARSAVVLLIEETSAAEVRVTLVDRDRMWPPLIRPSLSAAVRAALAQLAPPIPIPPPGQTPDKTHTKVWLLAGAATLVAGTIAVVLLLPDRSDRLQIHAPAAP
jgi:hypothetical protein